MNHSTLESGIIDVFGITIFIRLVYYNYYNFLTYN